MYTKEITLRQDEVHRLLASGSGAAALVHLYLACGNGPEDAGAALGLSQTQVDTALALLRQLGLWQDPPAHVRPYLEPPRYTEADVTASLDHEAEFRLLVGEVQRTLGRVLTTEELKILLSLRNYLNLPNEVISVLVCHCKERLRQKGSNRNPSLRTIEKEAYAWAEHGVTTLEEAVAFLQAQNARASRMAQLQQLLQLSGRNLTQAEERYASAWLDMGFDREALTMAYEKTCLNTGGLKWPYMNKILTSWHKQGLHTGQQVRGGDRRQPERSLGELERQAIAQMLQEEET